MSERLRAIVRWVALFGVRRPFFAVGIGVLLVALSSYVIPKLKISTSRRDLVSTENPLQKRTVEFDERFGYTSSPVIVVTGKTPEERRKVVDAVATELAKVPELDGRVLGRMTPSDVAEVLLLVDPLAFEKALPAGTDPVGDRVVEGISGWLGLLDTQLKKGLDEGKVEDASAGLERLAILFQALDEQLADGGGLRRMSQLTSESAAGELGKGLDESGYLAGSDDKHLIALFPALSGDEGYELRPLVEKIRAARDAGLQASGVTGVQADVTGVPALATDELEIIQADLFKTTVASTLAILLTLYWAFRSLRQGLVSFLPLGFGTIVTFGIVYLVLGHLNLITASFASVLLGIGDFGVHIQARYSELLRGGQPSKEAMEGALLKSGPGLVIATITTSVAFLTLMATEFTAFAELGLITSIGLVLMLVGAYLLVPPAMLLLLGPKPRPAPELQGFRKLSEFVRNHPRKILAGSLLVTAFFGFGLPYTTFNGRYFEFLPQEAESSRGLNALEKDPLVSPFVANVRASSIDEARRYAEELRALPTVTSVETATDMLPVLDEPRKAALARVVFVLNGAKGPVDFDAPRKEVDREAINKRVSALVDTLDEVGYALRQGGKDTKALDAAKSKLTSLRKRLAEVDADRISKLEADTLAVVGRAVRTAKAVAERGHYIPADLPALFHHRFVSKDQTELALFVHPKGDIWQVEVAEKFTADVLAIAPNTSGLATTLAEHPKMITRGFTRATILAVLFVLIVLYVGFRRHLDVFASAIPLAMGAIIMCGSMPMLGLSFNHANIVVVPLLLGLGLEASAHIVHRYRESATEHGGVAKLDEVLTGTGSAVFVGTLTTVWGFTAMMMADYRAMYWLGLVMTIGKLASLAASLLVLPALYVVTKKAE